MLNLTDKGPISSKYPLPAIPLLPDRPPPMRPSRLPFPKPLATAPLTLAWPDRHRLAGARRLAATLLGVWLLAGVQATGAQTAEDQRPIDVPVTRGTIDLGSIRPSLGPTARPESAPPSAAPPSTPASPATVPSAAAPAATAPGMAAGDNANMPRHPPRTVADFAALAKARAEAAARAQAGAAAATPITPPTAPTAPTAPMGAPTRPGNGTPASTQAAQAPAVPASPPAPAVAPRGNNSSVSLAPRLAPRGSQATRPAADTGLQDVAVKIVEAMARANEKQAAREAGTLRPSASGRTAAQAKPPEAAPPSSTSRDEIRAKAEELAAKALHGQHWTYEGDTGPANWAKLRPEFSVCALGKRQSPIAIDSRTTLQGPAEPIDFHYGPTEGSVLNNGHTIQVDLAPGNHLSVRGTRYDLVQFHFHHPAEEQVNGRTFPMVAHLVHRSEEGELAVVALLLDTGPANPAIDTVWTYMPLDTDDRVPMPGTVLDVKALLPPTLSYYQFMGSLTTPPCTEGVLWMVMKTPVTLSQAQITLFGQLFPLNARPVQPVHDRPVREAQ